MCPHKLRPDTARMSVDSHRLIASSACKFLLVWGAWCCTAFSAWGQAPTELLQRLEVETSKYQRTGSYAEVDAMCQSLAKNHPDAVRCFSIGRSAEGRPIWAMAVSRSGTLAPAQAKRLGIPVVLAIGGTHAGEIDGKDAGLMLIRDWLKKPPANDPLRQQIFCLCQFSTWTGMNAQARTTAPIKTAPACKASVSPRSALT